jgi:membrane-bound lytic murein transglycosylase D
MGKLVLYFFSLSLPLLCVGQEVLYKVAPQEPQSIPFEEPSLGKLLDDPENLVSPTFEIPDYFRDATRFWFDIYTQHPSSHSVLHDKENMALVYDVLDFSQVNASELNQFTKAALQSKYVDQIVSQYKAAFKLLAQSKDAGAIGLKIEKTLKSNGIVIPSKKERKNFYTKLSDNFRAQTGQKDRIQTGINSYARYKKTIESYFEAFDVPKELQAIPFLESSFNVRAKSKVGASGVWQFMRWIGAHFMPLDRRQDGRAQPLMATASALHLLKQNLKILGRWDLAISAYNSGTKHLLKAKRMLETKKTDISLANILANYEHEHLGFASRNFYASFLALTRALAYQDRFFDVPKAQTEIIHAYVSLCPIQPSWFFSAMKKHDPDISNENLHFNKRYLKHQFPRGTVLFTQADLTSRRYLKIEPKLMTTRYPKNWVLLAKGHNCSTK